MKLDLTVVILTKNEQLHIARAIDNVMPIARRVVVIDSESTDDTCRIAEEHGAEVVTMSWRGNQASQFNHTLDTVRFDTQWILRLDADEWLEPELIEEFRTTIPRLPDTVSAGLLPLGRCFMGRRLKHGIVNGIKIVRLFRPGAVRYEQRQMDEHLNILSGEVYEFKHKFVDDNRMPLSYFIAKHDVYALREAAVMLADKLGLSETGESKVAGSVASKRRQKSRYARMPRFWRATGYFCYRYFLRLGFLDGKEGFLWDYFQGWWYRMLVDAKLLEIERVTDNDPDKVLAYFREHGIKL